MTVVRKIYENKNPANYLRDIENLACAHTKTLSSHGLNLLTDTVFARISLLADTVFARINHSISLSVYILTD